MSRSSITLRGRSARRAPLCDDPTACGVISVILGYPRARGIRTYAAAAYHADLPPLRLYQVAGSPSSVSAARTFSVGRRARGSDGECNAKLILPRSAGRRGSLAFATHQGWHYIKQPIFRLLSSSSLHTLRLSTFNHDVSTRPGNHSDNPIFDDTQCLLSFPAVLSRNKPLGQGHCGSDTTPSSS